MTLSITNATLVNNETIAAGGYSASTTTIAAATAVALGFYAQVHFDASATAGATVAICGGIDATHTAVVQEVGIPLTAGGTVAVAFSVLPGHQHYLAVVRNDDAAQSITAVYVYAEPQVLS